MKYMGTHNTAAEAGAALIADQFHGFWTNDTNADITMRDILIDYAEAIEEGNDVRMQELQIEALSEVSDRLVLVAEDSGEVINADQLVRYLDGAVRFEMWSTSRNLRPMMADCIRTPRDGWRAIDGRIKRAALDWVEAIHEQDGALKLAHLLQELEAGR
jgi:hypothetical protein